MGTVIQLKKQINNSYFDLKNSVEEKLVLVDEKIKSKLISDVGLVQKMTDYHIETGGKRLRALLTLGSSKLCGYSKGGRDINLAACVELIHSATLMHDDVIDAGDLRRGKKTTNSIWGNQSSILVGDYLLSRCFEMMVEDGNLEILKLLSSTSSKIAQGEVLQLQHKEFINVVEESRGSKLKKNDIELFSGEFWSGSKAKELGLVDGLGNANEILKEKFGEDIVIKKFEKSKGWLAKKLSSSNQMNQFANILEERSIWQRYGF